jgi:hypothetical protein
MFPVRPSLATAGAPFGFVSQPPAFQIRAIGYPSRGVSFRVVEASASGDAGKHGFGSGGVSGTSEPTFDRRIDGRLVFFVEGGFGAGVAGVLSQSQQSAMGSVVESVDSLLSPIVSPPPIVGQDKI